MHHPRSDAPAERPQLEDRPRVSVRVQRPPPLPPQDERDRLWSRRHVYLDLRCDLEALPEVPKARLPVEMVPCDPPRVAVFRDELSRVDGADYVQVLLRAWMAEAGVRLMYLAVTPDGSPIY